MRSIEIFNCAALEIMNFSLEKFPVFIDIEPEMVAKSIIGYFYEKYIADITQKELSIICFSTIMWLAQEGFITIRQTYSNGKCSIVLTQKGLNALNSVPNFANTDAKKSFGEYFKEGLANLPFSMINGLMSEFFKSIS